MLFRILGAALCISLVIAAGLFSLGQYQTITIRAAEATQSAKKCDDTDRVKIALLLLKLENADTKWVTGFSGILRNTCNYPVIVTLIVKGKSTIAKNPIEVEGQSLPERYELNPWEERNFDVTPGRRFNPDITDWFLVPRVTERY